MNRYGFGFDQNSRFSSNNYNSIHFSGGQEYKDTPKETDDDTDGKALYYIVICSIVEIFWIFSFIVFNSYNQEYLPIEKRAPPSKFEMSNIFSSVIIN